ncbi:hypothetical protein PanWU01x14_081600 [Parasponia andersonii]|uniref:Uncharacterized protein n=1 Tax=Parasponia andersonii TaxID=3476 RepID=A0A2P5DAD2_PARAD|nr:hypothetical protein PanWU01x14_081600 [Parasponia andersonii]
MHNMIKIQAMKMVFFLFFFCFFFFSLTSVEYVIFSCRFISESRSL